jgi:hypothetical protein
VLATLAIVVWHFYFVIFDPEVYPMDTHGDRTSPRRAAERPKRNRPSHRCRERAEARRAGISASPV